MKYQLKEVLSESEAALFYKLPEILFGEDARFIAVPHILQAAILDKRRNPRLKHLRLKRWCLFKGTKPIGRIAAFDHPKPAQGESAGAFGFFDCIADDAAAAMLLDAAENQLKSWGATCIDGPIQPGENDQFWGLLVEGFDKPSYGANWNPPYYMTFVESAGYVPYYEQITNHITLSDGLPDRFFKIAAWVKQKGKISIEHFNKSKKQSFLRAVAHIYNHAWHHFENYREMTVNDVQREFDRFKFIMRDDLVWFAHINQEPAAFMLMLPDLNQYFERTGSNLEGLGKLRFWLVRHFFKPTKLKIVVMGVHASYQKLGVESVLIEAAYQQVKKKYPTVNLVELAWVGDFNSPMLALHQAAGAKPLRRHITYRKSLDDDFPVKKFEIKTD